MTAQTEQTRQVTYGYDAYPAAGARNSCGGLHRSRKGFSTEYRVGHSLVDELVIAFFAAMAVMWVVTAIAGIFG